jgi:hypothetical protein
VIGAQGSQSRFAFARNSPAIASGAFKRALAMAGVTADTPATVLCDGDAGLWRLQREALPNATVVLDWWHAAVRFEHALQAARGLGVADAHLATEAVRGLERAKWRLWHGRWPGCRRKLAALCRWARRTSICNIAGIGRLEHRVGELCWPISSETRERWSITPRRAGMANRSRPGSWRVRSTGCVMDPTGLHTLVSGLGIICFLPRLEGIEQHVDDAETACSSSFQNDFVTPEFIIENIGIAQVVGAYK